MFYIGESGHIIRFKTQILATVITKVKLHMKKQEEIQIIACTKRDEETKVLTDMLMW